MASKSNTSKSTASSTRNLPVIPHAQQYKQSSDINQAHPSASAQYPPWAAQLINNVRDINNKLSKLDTIEKTLNCLSVKVHDLDNKVSAMDTRITYVEGCCSFISDKYETHKQAIPATNESLLEMKQKCDRLESSMASLCKEKRIVEDRITDTEARSMRENFLFHGISETEGENCVSLNISAKLNLILRQNLRIISLLTGHTVSVRFRRETVQMLMQAHKLQSISTLDL